jgi:hypothetical protein
MKMKRTKFKVKLGIDLALIAIFLVNMFTGFAMFFGLATGGGRRGAEGFNVLALSGLSKGALFRFIHDWSGILIAVLILVHLALNWNTLWCYLRNTLKNRNIENIEASCENI